MKSKIFLLALPLMFIVASCSNDKMADLSYPEVPGGIYDDDFGEGSEGEVSDPANGTQGQAEAGRVTAGEWRDLDNWLFWSNLMTNTQADQEGSDFTGYSSYWSLYTNNRVAISATNAGGEPLVDAKVTLKRANGSVLWTARTDNKGNANLWIGFTQLSSDIDENSLTISLNDIQQDIHVEVTRWGEEVKINKLTEVQSNSVKVSAIDIAFIVDATGSMSDEINFLKADLQSIINDASLNGKNIRTSALFYRDEGDEYITRVSDFSNHLSTTTNFISRQSADGGGDYPEAVHTALETGLQQLSWNENNSIRLAFMLLDAPPHKNEQVIASLQKSIPQYAAKGIRIIPIAASGVDKPTEFFLRFTAIATDATYVFITNDSGIGGEHIQATVGDYKVELLRDLIVRLITQYGE